MSVPTVVLLAICVLYGWRHRGHNAAGIVLGMALGVAGAGGWVGELMRQLTTAGVSVLSQVAHALPL